MALGLLIKPSHDPKLLSCAREQLGIPTASFPWTTTSESSQRFLHRAQRSAGNTGSLQPGEVVGPGPLKWDFIDGPSTIGIVSKSHASARVDALKQTSTSRRCLYRTHPDTLRIHSRESKEPLYEEAVLAIRDLAEYCGKNGQSFLWRLDRRRDHHAASYQGCR